MRSLHCLVRMAFLYGLAAITIPARSEGASVMFASNPTGANVSMDGGAPRKTPCLMEGVGRGRHAALFELDYRYETLMVDFVLAAPETTIHAVLRPRIGRLYIASDPENGQCFVDGRRYGRTPVVIEELSYGPHSVRVEFPTGQGAETVDVRYPESTVRIRIDSVAERQTQFESATGEARRTKALAYSLIPGGGSIYMGKRWTAFQDITLIGGALVAGSISRVLADAAERDYEQSREEYRTAVSPDEIDAAWKNVEHDHDTIEDYRKMEKIAGIAAGALYLRSIARAFFWSPEDAGASQLPGGAPSRRGAGSGAPIWYCTLDRSGRLRFGVTCTFWRGNSDRDRLRSLRCAGDEGRK